MPPKIRGQVWVGRQGRVFVLHRVDTVIARLSLGIAASGCLSGVAGAVRRGGWIHLFAVTGRGGRNADACVPG
jgi:hypothetical protein